MTVRIFDIMGQERQDVPPWCWSLEDRLAQANKCFEKTAEKYPMIAESWLREIDSIETKIRKRDQVSDQS